MSDFQRPNNPQPSAYESYTQPLPPGQEWGAPMPPPNAMPPVMSPYANQSYYVPMTTQTQRPGGVAAIAVWHWVLAGLYGLVGVAVIGLGGTALSMLQQAGELPAGAGTLGFGVFLVFFLLFAAIAAALFFAGRGLWKMSNGGRIMTIVVDGIYIFLTGLGLLGADSDPSIVSVAGMLIAIATIVYLCTPKVRALFR